MNPIQLAIETNENGTQNLIDQDGRIIVESGTSTEIDRELDLMVEYIESFKSYNS